MRPIEKPVLAGRMFEASATALLMQSFGEYCSMCERPLPAESWAWHKLEAQATDGPLPEDDWPYILLLCHNCREAAEDRESPAPGSILYPDEHLTFGLRDGSPFSYQLKSVTRKLVNEFGEAVSEPEDIECVMVTGGSRQAKMTIDFFQLNTKYCDDGSRQLIIPVEDYLSRADPRLDQRTAVWHMVAAQISHFREQPNKLMRDTVLDMMRQIAVPSGYWSVWATVLWRELEDLEILERVLLPPDESRLISSQRSPVFEDVGVGPGHHNPFPGTSRNWLPR